MKTVFRVVIYEVSKDSSPTEFPIMSMRKPLCKDRLKSFPPSFLIPRGCLGFAPYTRSWVGQIQIRIGMCDLVARYVNISCLSTEVRPYVRPASGQRDRYFFMSSCRRGVPWPVKVSLLGSAGGCIIRILPGNSVVITTYISFH
jgi:hypothetical protein